MSEEPGFAGACVAVVGLGLMGGSLAGALATRQACRQVVGVSRRPETLRTALERGWIHHGTTDLIEGTAQADVVVLATPPRVVLRQLREIGPHLQAGTLVMDLASTKAQVLRAMEGLPACVQPLGGHPMCGKEQAGIEAAQPDLFAGRPFILSPLPRTSAGALEQGKALVRAVGAVPVVLDAADHDRMVAWVSHLPHTVALSLMGAAMAGAQQDPGLWSLAASGFRDTTRLAASDPDMMLDIFLTNQENILRAMNAFREQFDKLYALIEAGGEAPLREFIEAASRRRRELNL
jgi:prephenate dehydrogenase